MVHVQNPLYAMPPAPMHRETILNQPQTPENRLHRCNRPAHPAVAAYGAGLRPGPLVTPLRVEGDPVATTACRRRRESRPCATP